jgi:hypothetical protein
MPIRTALWKVSTRPQPLTESSLASERLLEDMIVSAPSLLSDEWMLIGRQEDTGFGGRIDLLAIEPDGALVLIEIKRGRTPREVVAQALDYAAWVQTLQPDQIAAIYRRFASGRDLAEDFRARFGQALDEESLNQSHQIVIVASSLDDSSERIVAYLNERGISINVLCFQLFAHDEEQLISRAWLLDPVREQAAATSRADAEREAWNGEFYVSFGDNHSRSWEEAVQYGFISGGGAPWYSRTLKLLAPGDRVWVNVPGRGYVGVGTVKGKAQSAADFCVLTPDGEKPAEHCEYFVPVQWKQTVPLDEAVREFGLFGNQNTVCKPTSPKWNTTVERLKARFPRFDS